MVPPRRPPRGQLWSVGRGPFSATGEGHLEEDQMAGWHHRLNRHEFEETLGDGDRQGGLACCSLWGLRESDMNERLN